MNIEGSVALVSGATSDIGRALTQAWLDAGAKRVYAAMPAPNDEQLPENVIPIRLDTSDSQDVRAAAALCSDVDILLNAASSAREQPLLGSVDTRAAEREMRVNYFGTLAMCRAFAPVLANNGGGALVNVLSFLAQKTLPRHGSYAASQAAALSLSDAIRVELSTQGTLVLAVLAPTLGDALLNLPGQPTFSHAELANEILRAVRADRQSLSPGPAS